MSVAAQPQPEMNEFESNAIYDGLRVKLTFAPLGRRILAYATDMGLITTLLYGLFIVGVMLFVPLFAFVEVATQGSGLGRIVMILLTIVMLCAVLAIYHGYFVYFEHKHGATPGKRIFGLKVVTLDGSKLSLGQCVIRDVMRYVDCMLVVPGLLSIIISKKHQRLGDLMAGTVIIHSAEKEAENTLLYLSGESFELLKELLKPGPIPADECKRFSKYAYGRFITNTTPSPDVEFVERRWRSLAESYFSEPSPELETETVLLFFAELCHQALTAGEI